jgi:hypothetical protein
MGHTCTFQTRMPLVYPKVMRQSIYEIVYRLSENLASARHSFFSSVREGPVDFNPHYEISGSVFRSGKEPEPNSMTTLEPLE